MKLAFVSQRGRFPGPTNIFFTEIGHEIFIRPFI